MSHAVLSLILLFSDSFKKKESQQCRSLWISIITFQSFVLYLTKGEFCFVLFCFQTVPYVALSGFVWKRCRCLWGWSDRLQGAGTFCDTGPPRGSCQQVAPGSNLALKDMQTMRSASMKQATPGKDHLVHCLRLSRSVWATITMSIWWTYKPITRPLLIIGAPVRHFILV